MQTAPVQYRDKFRPEPLIPTSVPLSQLGEDWETRRPPSAPLLRTLRTAPYGSDLIEQLLRVHSVGNMSLTRVFAMIWVVLRVLLVDRLCAQGQGH